MPSAIHISRSGRFFLLMYLPMKLAMNSKMSCPIAKRGLRKPAMKQNTPPQRWRHAWFVFPKQSRAAVLFIKRHLFHENGVVYPRYRPFRQPTHYHRDWEFLSFLHSLAFLWLYILWEMCFSSADSSSTPIDAHIGGFQHVVNFLETGGEIKSIHTCQNRRTCNRPISAVAL